MGIESYRAAFEAGARVIQITTVNYPDVNELFNARQWREWNGKQCDRLNPSKYILVK